MVSYRALVCLQLHFLVRIAHTSALMVDEIEAHDRMVSYSALVCLQLHFLVRIDDTSALMVNEI